jgi:hypothetical protein
MMTPDQYRKAYDRLGLTQVGVARFLGYDERTSRRWAAGDLPIPKHVEILLRIMLAYEIRPEDALKLAGMTQMTRERGPIRDARFLPENIEDET